MPEILSNIFFHLGQSVGQRYIWYGLATNRNFFTLFILFTEKKSRKKNTKKYVQKTISMPIFCPNIFAFSSQENKDF